jgi:hypothetical protein
MARVRKGAAGLENKQWWRGKQWLVWEHLGRPWEQLNSLPFMGSDREGLNFFNWGCVLEPEISGTGGQER